MLKRVSLNSKCCSLLCQEVHSFAWQKKNVRRSVCCLYMCVLGLGLLLKTIVCLTAQIIVCTMTRKHSMLLLHNCIHAKKV